MKRREFLTMLIGAAIAVPAIKAASTASPADESRADMLTEVYTGLAEMAREYVNSDAADRRIFIQELDRVIPQMRPRPRQAMISYRNMLLSYSAKTEVTR